LKRVSVAETIQDRVLDPRSSSDSEKLDPGTNEQAAHNRSPTGRRGWSNDGSLLGHCWRGWGYDYLDVGCKKGRRHQDSSDGRKTDPAHVNLYAGALGLSASSASDSSSESGKGSVPTAKIAGYCIPRLTALLGWPFGEALADFDSRHRLTGSAYDELNWILRESINWIAERRRNAVNGASVDAPLTTYGTQPDDVTHWHASPRAAVGLIYPPL
jgi:hypothetical protein